MLLSKATYSENICHIRETQQHRRWSKKKYRNNWQAVIWGSKLIFIKDSLSAEELRLKCWRYEHTSCLISNNRLPWLQQVTSSTGVHGSLLMTSPEHGVWWHTFALLYTLDLDVIFQLSSCEARQLSYYNNTSVGKRNLLIIHLITLKLKH